MLESLKEKRPRLYHFINNTDRLLDRISDHHLFLIAAGIAFNILLYLIPLFLMAVYVVNMLFGIEIIADTLEKLLLDLFPPTESARALIKTILEEVYIINRHSSIAGWIGVGILLWLSSTLFSSFRTGLNAIFRIPSPKMFIVYKLKDIFLAVTLALLILLSSYVVPMTSFMNSILEENLPDLIGTYISMFTIALFSFIPSFLAFYLLFRFVPNSRIERFPRLISTGLCVVLIEASRNLFAWYLTSLSNYGRFYGAYAVIVSMAVWVYYFTFIILVSAETGQFLYDLKEEKKKEKEAEPAPVSNENKTEETSA